MMGQEEMILFDRIVPVSGLTTKPRHDWCHPRQEKKPEAEKTHWRHAGIDIFPQKGVAGAVFAQENGEVYYVDKECKSGTHGGGYGPGVIGIAGESAIFHWNAHMDPATFTVKKGDKVKIGQPLGAVVGTWTHPELHWETRWRAFCPYSKDYPYPWTITIDPWRWLQEKQLTAREATKGLVAGEDLDRKLLRPGGYPLKWTAKEGVFAIEVDPFLERVVTPVEPEDEIGIGTILFGLGVVGGVGYLLYKELK